MVCKDLSEDAGELAVKEVIPAVHGGADNEEAEGGGAEEAHDVKMKGLGGVVEVVDLLAEDVSHARNRAVCQAFSGYGPLL